MWLVQKMVKWLVLTWEFERVMWMVLLLEHELDLEFELLPT